MGELIGRFHPLIVHLPIGILIAAFLMEIASRYFKMEHLKKSIPFVLLLALCFSILAWFTGWIIPKEGAFSEYLIGLHFWFAIALTVTTAITYLCRISANKSLNKCYFPLMIITMILLTATGHYGGSLTHGEDYLTQALKEEKAPIISDVNSSFAYKDIIQPILKQKCFSCHNDGKQKGGLMMTTMEGMLKGGDEGPLFIANDAPNSALIRRVHLPLDDKKHMPPKGKKELIENEIKLISWWIDEGASFDKPVGALNQSEEIKSILKLYEQREVEIDVSRIDRLSQETLNDYKEMGISIYPLNEESPLLIVNLSRDSIDIKKKLKRLTKIKENIVELDLSFSNLENNAMSTIAKFKNLQHLKIQNTKVNSEGLKEIKDLPNLKVLNLYNTEVDDNALSSLSKMKSLQSIYLWQTKATDQAIANFKESNPLKNIQHKIPDHIFQNIKLKAPSITANAEIFKDTLSVSMNINLKDAKIYYTLDNSDPDSNAILYREAIVLDQSQTLKAICMKKGWDTSDPIERTFIKAGHEVTDVSLNIQPNKKYFANGASSLVDLKKGNNKFAEGNWLGFQGQDVMVDLDLGEVKSLKSIAVSALEDINSYIFYPKGIEVETSLDGKSFTNTKQINIPIPNTSNPANQKSFLLEFDKHDARYIRVAIAGVLKNPDWHPAPGAKNWVFIDEIIVN
ncbi:MAG: FN3 associated domain-containing protein [Bacteroidota bacterium]